MPNPGRPSGSTRSSALVVGILAGTLSLSACQSVPVQGPVPRAPADTTPPVIGAIGELRPPAGPLTASTAKPEAAPEWLGPATSAHERQLRSLFRSARQWVETTLGEPLDHVGLAFAPATVIDVEVARETARLVAAQFDDVGLAQALQSELARAQRGSYAALFSPDKSLVLVDEGLHRRLVEQADARRIAAPLAEGPTSAGGGSAMADAALQALFVHELIHAADDARHGIVAHRDLDFRASFAQAAVYEGHAQFRTREICERHGCLDGLAHLERHMFAETETHATGGPVSRSFSNSVLTFAYREGERFVAGLSTRENGTSLIEHALATPPRDPAQILVPMSYPNDERESRNQLLLTHALAVLHPWRADPFHMVAVSPLRGLTLGDRPDERAEVIAGLTTHAVAMVGLQIYDRGAARQQPPEATLMQTTTDSIAALYANSLHEEARFGATSESFRRATARRSDGAGVSIAVQIAAHRSPLAGERFVVTASAGRHVVQVHDPRTVSGADSAIDFALQFLRRAERLGDVIVFTMAPGQGERETVSTARATPAPGGPGATGALPDSEPKARRVDL